jgi:hypothetical protein
VKFKNGLYTDEEGAAYRVMEINGNREIIEFICQLPILPQSVAKIDELEPKETGDNDEKKIVW